MRHFIDFEPADLVDATKHLIDEPTLWKLDPALEVLMVAGKYGGPART